MLAGRQSCCIGWPSISMRKQCLLSQSMRHLRLGLLGPGPRLVELARLGRRPGQHTLDEDAPGPGSDTRATSLKDTPANVRRACHVCFSLDLSLHATPGSCLGVLRRTMPAQITKSVSSSLDQMQLKQTGIMEMLRAGGLHATQHAPQAHFCSGVSSQNAREHC